MKYIPTKQFINNCYMAYKNGRLDSVNKLFRKIANNFSSESLTEMFKDVPALKFFLQWVKPLEDEYLINWTSDRYKNAEIYILTNHRFIYQEKGSLKVIEIENIESVKVNTSPLNAILKIQLIILHDSLLSARKLKTNPVKMIRPAF